MGFYFAVAGEVKSLLTINVSFKWSSDSTGPNEVKSEFNFILLVLPCHITKIAHMLIEG